MPLQFRCPACRETISVSSRLAGATSPCPNCKAEITVPMPGQPKQSPSSTSSASTDPQVSSLPKAQPLPSDYEDAVAVLKRPVQSKPVEAPTYHLDEAGDGIVLPRRILFAQAILLAFVSGVTLLAGFAMGWAVHRSADDSADAQRGRPVKFQGKIRLPDKSGKPQADAGALVVAIPLHLMQSRENPLAATDLKFDESAANPENSPAGQEIARSGGSLAKSNDAGDFALNVAPGYYRLLIISRRAVRSKAEKPDAAQFASLGRIIAPAADLLADRQFRWTIVEVGESQHALQVQWDK